jgi:uncharacterized protein YcbK (DUF882 family)
MSKIYAIAVAIFMFFTFEAYALKGVSISCVPASIKSKLHYIEKHFSPVEVVSAFRKNGIIAGTRIKSKHASCQAVDFQVLRNKTRVVQWLKTQKIELIQYTCGMHHLHIATGSYRGVHCVDSRGIRKKAKRK